MERIIDHAPIMVQSTSVWRPFVPARLVSTLPSLREFRLLWTVYEKVSHLFAFFRAPLDARLRGDRLSAEEYAEACGDLADDLQDNPALYLDTAEDIDEIIDAVKDAVEEFKDLSPPKEYERLHELKAQYADLTFEASQDTGLFELVMDLQDLQEDVDDLDFDEQMELMAELEEEWMGRMEEIEEELEEY